METHHDTAVPEGASPARFEGCSEEGTMRYSARVRGTARLKIARYIKENADEGREEVGREEEGGQGKKGPGDGMACRRVARWRERARRAGAQTL